MKQQDYIMYAYMYACILNMNFLFGRVLFHFDQKLKNRSRLIFFF